MASKIKKKKEQKIICEGRKFDIEREDGCDQNTLHKILKEVNKVFLKLRIINIANKM